MTSPVRSSLRKPLVQRIAIVVVAIAVIAVLGYAYASPYVALDRLKRATDARDAEAINQYVDYPALRESLKEQVTDLLMRRVDEQTLTHPLAALGAVIGVALVGAVVDAYATPEGVTALLAGMPPTGARNDRPQVPSSAPASNAAQPPSAAPPGAASSAPAPSTPRTTAGYRGINEFAVTYRNGPRNAPYSAILHREGLFSWKLVAVELNG